MRWCLKIEYLEHAIFLSIDIRPFCNLPRLQIRFRKVPIFNVVYPLTLELYMPLRYSIRPLPMLLIRQKPPLKHITICIHHLPLPLKPILYKIPLVASDTIVNQHKLTLTMLPIVLKLSPVDITIAVI